MKRSSYTLIIAWMLMLTCINLTAQTWRGKHNGLQSGISANIVYGDGTNILIGNSSAFSGHPMYYTPDSSTLFNYSSSTLGTYTAIESQVVKCMGHLFVGSSHGIYKSNDLGQTWSLAGTSTTGNLPSYGMYALNDTLYVGNALGGYFSTDTGLTWTTVPGYTGSMPVAFLRAGNILYVGGTSTLQYTTDWGASWQNVTSPASIIRAAVAGITKLGTNVYAATNNGVYQSTDNGHTWTRVIAKVFTSIITIDTSVLAGTSTNGIYQSDHSGTTWTAINNGLPYTGVATYNSITSISSNNNFIMCIAGGDSVMYVLGYSDLGLQNTSGTASVKSMAATKPEFDIFPNPASQQVTLTIGNCNAEQVEISMFDASGKCFKSMSCKFSPTMNLDVSNVPAGIYFLSIHAGNSFVTRKLAVVHLY